MEYFREEANTPASGMRVLVDCIGGISPKFSSLPVSWKMNPLPLPFSKFYRDPLISPDWMQGWLLPLPFLC